MYWYVTIIYILTTVGARTYANFCEPNPCIRNNTDCVNGAITYECNCKTGYAEPDCTPIDHCKDKTDDCSRNAVCISDGPGTFECQCFDGYTGDGKACEGLGYIVYESGKSLYAVNANDGTGVQKLFDADDSVFEYVDQTQEFWFTDRPSLNISRYKLTVGGEPAVIAQKDMQHFTVIPNRQEVFYLNSTDVNKVQSFNYDGVDQPTRGYLQVRQGFEEIGNIVDGDNEKLYLLQSDDNNLVEYDLASGNENVFNPGNTGIARRLSIDSAKKEIFWLSYPQTSDYQILKTALDPTVVTSVIKTGADDSNSADITHSPLSYYLYKDSKITRYNRTDNVEVNSYDVPNDVKRIVWAEGIYWCNSNTCPPNTTCVNKFKGPECKCEEGYKLEVDQCVEIDECLEGLDNCHNDAFCTNTDGSFNCTCNKGFEENGTDCQDINECNGDNNCTDPAVCNNTIGSYNCDCPTGYIWNINACEDINECNGDNNCTDPAVCNNTIGSYKCDCPTGYIWEINACEDINECNGDNDCTDPAVCNNTIGSYNCDCPTGFIWNINACEDINECNGDNNCTDPAVCNNTIGSYKCDCPTGYIWEMNACEDINECNGDNNCTDPAVCNNTIGSYKCDCPTGYIWNINACEDIDECVSSPCTVDASCINNNGSYTCVCNVGFKGDGVTNCTGEMCRVEALYYLLPTRIGGILSDGTSPFELPPTIEARLIDYDGENEKLVYVTKTDELKMINVDGTGEALKQAFSPSLTHFTLTSKYSYMVYFANNEELVKRLKLDDTVETLFDSSGFSVDQIDADPLRSTVFVADGQNGGIFKVFPSFYTIFGTTTTSEDIAIDEINNILYWIMKGNGRSLMKTDLKRWDSGNNATSVIKTFTEPTGEMQIGIGKDHIYVKDDLNKKVHRIEKLNYTDILVLNITDTAQDFAVGVDVDECCLGAICPPTTTCLNTIASYICRCGEGTLGIAPNCTDIDECIEETDDCHKNATCGNFFGSYNCTCDEGFTGDGKINCANINECSNTSICHENAGCFDNVGSYDCVCNQGYTGDGVDTCDDIKECLDPNICTVNANNKCDEKEGSYECVCADGYEGLPEDCQDKNECSDPDICGLNEKCSNKVGGYDCVCVTGYFLNNDSVCEDINECLKDGLCPSNSECINNGGSYECKCNGGFEKNGEICQDIDECLIVNICPDDNECFNEVSTYRCDCKTGFVKKNGICKDINECDITDICTGNTYCINTHGSYYCKCLPGFDKARNCQDIDECSLSNACPPNTDCVNSVGSYTCPCSTGFIPNGDQCIDVNECSIGSPCHSDAICDNLIGSFKCTCKAGYSGDGINSCADSTACVSCKDNENCVNRQRTQGYECECINPGQSIRGSCGDVNRLLASLNVIVSTVGVGNHFDPNTAAYRQKKIWENQILDRYLFAGATEVKDVRIIAVQHEPLTNTARLQYILTFPDEKDYTIASLTQTHNNGIVTTTDGSFFGPLKLSSNNAFNIQDYDECSPILGVNAPSCDKNAVCVNKEANFDCTCNDGYTSSGKRSCQLSDKHYVSYDDTQLIRKLLIAIIAVFCLFVLIAIFVIAAAIYTFAKADILEVDAKDDEYYHETIEQYYIN